MKNSRFFVQTCISSRLQRQKDFLLSLFARKKHLFHGQERIFDNDEKKSLEVSMEGLLLAYNAHQRLIHNLQSQMLAAYRPCYELDSCHISNKHHQ